MSGAPQVGTGLTCDEVAFGGWARNVRLSNGIVEIVATLDVGPRVIHFAFVGEASPLAVIPRQAGLTGGDSWRMYGGHRLWHAPESSPRTYVPDNSRVSHAWDGTTLVLEPAVETATGIAKHTEVSLDLERPVARVRHRLANDGAWPIELAPWALTAMRQGGRAIFPRDPYRPHDASTLLPASTIALWPYSNMADPRWTWGRKFVQLRQDPQATGPTKFGYANRQGWAAYAVDDVVFVHRFPHVDGARYPDLGCNCESFTNGEILELESLGPLTTVPPGASVEHQEEWLLVRASPGEAEDAIDATLTTALSRF